MTAGEARPGTAADLDALARFAAEADSASLPDGIAATVRAGLLYGLAVGVATLHGAAPRLACDLVDLEAGEAGVATRLLDGRKVSPSQAAFTNAVLMSGRVQGDSHPAGHLGGVIIPVVLALAEARRLSGREVLASLLAAYEVALRIGRDHATVLSRRGFRTTPCYGVFGAAAAAARALKLSPEAVRGALSLASNLASGLREYVNAGTDESPYQAGFAARNGMTAALLMANPKALSTAGSALHGEAGFFNAYGEGGMEAGARLAEGLGEQFELANVTYKPYPACQFLRGMIRGLIALRAQANGVPAASIALRFCPFEADFIGVRYTGPFFASSQTVMSAPFCASLAFVHGVVGYAGLRTFDDPAVLDLVPRVSITADPALSRYRTKIDVHLTDGRTLSLDDHAGDAEYRLAWDAVSKASATLCDEVGAPSRDLIAAVSGVEAAEDIAAVIAAARDAIAKAKP